MTHGYVSDVEGDDTVMQQPEATVTIDVSDLPPQQKLMLMAEAGLDQYDPYDIGLLQQGEDTDNPKDVHFHLPLGTALTILNQIGAIDLPQQPPGQQQPDPNDIPDHPDDVDHMDGDV